MIPTPSHPAITTPYGKPGSWSGGVHGGADFGSPGIDGAEIAAAWGGVIIGLRVGGHRWGSTWGDAYGNHAVIDFDPLPDGDPGLFGLIAAHASDLIIGMGQRIEPGQLVGYVGSTGNSTGPHEHFEVQRQAHWASGGHTDPQPWLDAATAPPTGQDQEEDDEMKPWAVNIGTGWKLTDFATYQTHVLDYAVISEGEQLGCLQVFAGGNPVGKGWIDHIDRLPRADAPAA